MDVPVFVLHLCSASEDVGNEMLQNQKGVVQLFLDSYDHELFLDHLFGLLQDSGIQLQLPYRRISNEVRNLRRNLVLAVLEVALAGPYADVQGLIRSLEIVMANVPVYGMSHHVDPRRLPETQAGEVDVSHVLKKEVA